MSLPGQIPDEADEIPWPVVPTQAAWAAMSPAEQEAFYTAVQAAAEAEAAWLAEGSKHSLSIIDVHQQLRQFFRRQRRDGFIRAHMDVYIPGENTFRPDLFVVLDVPDPGMADLRRGWWVEREGQGVDLVLEMLDYGDATKDLVRNVVRFARLGVREYFVYDWRETQIHGWRLAVEGAPYTKIIPSEERLTSIVLGLELGIEGGRPRFYQQGAVVDGDAELLAKANDRLGEAVSNFDAAVAARLAAEVRAEAAEARAEAERQARQAADQARVEAEARVAALEALLAQVRRGEA